MSAALFIELAWKSCLCAGLTLLILAAMRNRSAAQKSLVAHLGILTLVLLPIGTVLLPEIGLTAPEALSSAYSQVANGAAGAAQMDSYESVSAAMPGPSDAQPAQIGWQSILLYGYGFPAAILILLTAAAVIRLQLLRFRSQVVMDSEWLTALAAAQHRLGLKHGTALLRSSELKSPVSWGVVRPIIIIDPEVSRDVARAEAIIAHELAHVARLDWLALILGRLVIALFWFNPLVWVLARKSHDLCEQAADDAVLRSNIPGPEYADILVQAARHSTSPVLLAANGVAPSSSSLGRRVMNVLDSKRSRVPVRMGWSAICLVAAMGLGAATAAVEPQLAGAGAGSRGDFGAGAAAALANLGTPQSQALANAISTQNWNARQAKGSAPLNQREAAKPLLTALRDNSPLTRRLAVWGISELRFPEAEAPVAHLLRDEVGYVRAEAARALGDLGAAGRSGEIASLLKDREPEVRRQAAHALGDLQEPSTRPALEASLRDPDPKVRAKISWALRQLSEAEKIIERYGGR